MTAMLRPSLLALALLAWVGPAARAAEPTPEAALEEKLRKLARDHAGTVSIAVKYLDSGKMILIDADTVLPTASLIKLPIMVEVYAQAKEGTLKLDETLTLTREEMVQGSGILTEHFSPGAQFSLRDAVRLMIVYSDNTATNMVLERIGIPSTNARMEGMKLPNTRINAKVFKGSKTSIDPERTKKYGLGSTTAREMLQLLEGLHQGTLVGPEASKAMLEHLKKCDDNEKFPRFLPKSVVVAHKTGSVSNARTDAGILYLKSGPVAVCVLTNENKDQSWVEDNAGNRLCAEVAKLLYLADPKTK